MLPLLLAVAGTGDAERNLMGRHLPQAGVICFIPIPTTDRDDIFPISVGKRREN